MIRLNQLLAVVAVFSFSFSVTAQSKKVLLAQVTALKAKNDSLIKSYETKQTLMSKKDTFSYAMGVELFSNNLKQQGLDTALNVDAFYIGLKNAEMGKDQMSQADRQGIIQETFAKIDEKRQALQRIEDEKKNAGANANLLKGQKFLAENKAKSGVVALPSGLQYKVLEGSQISGTKPTSADQVKVHYEGKLIDGTVFDSSYKRGAPATFGVTQVIKGWTEILQLMNEGDKWEVYIPSDLAYGPRGSRSSIGPNETLIFIVELIEVVK